MIKELIKGIFLCVSWILSFSTCIFVEIYGQLYAGISGISGLGIIGGIFMAIAFLPYLLRNK